VGFYGRSDCSCGGINLGVMFAEGEGVPQDIVQAFMWFSLAAAQNHKDAIENRDNAASTMSAALRPSLRLSPVCGWM
jgi:TPR repeat protein